MKVLVVPNMRDHH